MQEKKKVEFKKHYSKCRCKGKIEKCRFCNGTKKYHQGYYLIANGIGFYVDTLK